MRMNNLSKKLKTAAAAMIAAALIFTMAACANNGKTAAEEESSVITASGLSAEQTDSLMKQIANSDVADVYGEYLTNEAFAAAEIFGIDRNGDDAAAYAYLFEGGYVVFKDKAYNMSGSSGTVIIKFTFDDNDGVTLSEVVWSADGDLQDAWMKENFPAEYLKKAESYNAYDENGNNVLAARLEKTVEEKLGVPVAHDELLTIDTDNGTYELVRTIDGENGAFDTEPIEKGDLAALQTQQ